MKTGWSGREGHEKLLDVGFLLQVEPAALLTDSKGDNEKGLDIERAF